MAIILDPKVAFLREHNKFRVNVLDTDLGDWKFGQDSYGRTTKKFIPQTILINKEWLEKKGHDLMKFTGFGDLSYFQICEMAEKHGIKMPHWPPRYKDPHKHDIVAMVGTDNSQSLKIKDIIFKCRECGTRYAPAGWKKIYD